MDKIKEIPIKSLSEVCLKNFYSVNKCQGSPELIRTRSLISSPDVLKAPVKPLSPLLSDPNFLKTLIVKENIKPCVEVKRTESRTTQTTVHSAESVAIQTEPEEPPPVIETKDAIIQTERQKKCGCCAIM